MNNQIRYQQQCQFENDGNILIHANCLSVSTVQFKHLHFQNDNDNLIGVSTNFIFAIIY